MADTMLNEASVCKKASNFIQGFSFSKTLFSKQFSYLKAEMKKLIRALQTACENNK
jgi:hypothetical protein